MSVGQFHVDGGGNDIDGEFFGGGEGGEIGIYRLERFEVTNNAWVMAWDIFAVPHPPHPPHPSPFHAYPSQPYSPHPSLPPPKSRYTE